MSTHRVKKIRKKKIAMYYAKRGETERADYDDGTHPITMSSEME